MWKLLGVIVLALAPGATPRAEIEHDAWKAVGVAQPADKPRILLIHDMEGLAGQDNPYSFLYGHPEYPRGQQLLIEDVNAVVAGLFAGGAGSVSVADGHGSGNPGPDILIDRLDRRAQMVSRPSSFDTYLDLAEKGAFDAVVAVGMHAKSGSGGFASHTFGIGSRFLVNGWSITETELLGLLHGRVGIPVIFASGDDRLANDLKTMPWIHYVTTKKARNAWSAELYPVEQVRAELTRQARLAVEQLAAAKVMRTEGPLRIAVRAVPPASLSWLEGMPGIDYENETVSFIAQNIADAFTGMLSITSALAFSYSEAQLALNAQPDAQKLKQLGAEELYRIWLDAESGKTKPNPPHASPPKEHYHGYD